MSVESSGPQPCDVLIVGEAPGKDEDFLRTPFVGASGMELRRMLNQAGFPGGIRRVNEKHSTHDVGSQTYRLSNVFNVRPENNDVNRFCGNRGSVGKSYRLPPLSTGNYVLPEHLDCLQRLDAEIRHTKPRLIIAVGNTPCWALLQRTGISKLRGHVFPCELPGLRDVPVLATYHPAAVLRDWSLRVIAVQDLMKAKRFLDEGFHPAKRELVLAPDLSEVTRFLDQWIFNNPPRVLSFDIETRRESITCIGFSPTNDRAITIPFYDPSKPDGNYWATAREERDIWRLVSRVLSSDIPKLGQNGLYDIQYLYRHGILVKNYLHDTMIRHHSLHPELEKGLGFLGSIYTDEAPWKLLRKRTKENFKLEDE